MKRSLVLITFLALAMPVAVPAAQTAHGRAYCISVKLGQAWTPSYNGGFRDWLRVNSSATPEGDDELIPWDLDTVTDMYLPGAESYLSGLTVYDDLWEDTYYGSFYPNLPTLTDDNNNRYPDFFEVSQAVNLTSGGSYSLGGGWGQGSLQLVWTRAAGSSTGTCVIELQDWGIEFYAPFEILEYTGPVTYTPAATKVTGSVNLIKTGDASKYFRGPFEMRKSPGNPNELTVQVSAWTNATGVLSVTNHLFTRETAWPTNYGGYIHFDQDGDPWTFQTWRLWVFSISDPNDTDADGIPNFADDPVTVLPRRPQISLQRDSSTMRLTIRGDVGFTHQVQEASSPAGPWSPGPTVTLTTDPQIVSLPAEAGPKYYRVMAQPN